MAQHDYVISNGTGAAVRSDLNNALLAIVSQNSGATEPATMYAYQWWADTTTGTLKLRNSANNAWIELMQLDGTLTMEDGTAALPGLAFRDDLNTGIFRPGTDQFAISTNGVERVEWGTSEVVFNDGGVNYDFRVEGDTNANLFFVDASADAVGIGTTPSATLHVAPSSGSANFQISRGSKGLQINQDSDSADPNINTIGTTALKFLRDGSESARFDTSGRFLVGTSSDRSGFRLQVEGTDGPGSSFGQARNTNDSNPPIYGFYKSRGTTANSKTVVQNGDRLGIIAFHGADGTNDVAGAYIETFVDGTPGTNDMPGRLVFSTTKDGASSPSERMRIDNLGRTCINQTSVTDFGALSVTYNSGDSSNQAATGININQSNASTGTMMGFRNSAGTVIGTITNNNNGTITYNNSSDYRLKENIIDLDGAIDRLQTIQVRRFNFIGFPDKTVDGFVAHEIQDVVPEAVTGEKDAVDGDGNPVYQGIDQSKLVPLLTAALQEAIGEIESLKARVAALEAQ